ncbi:DgyrCDS10323 [Dimorphilus gyrociliatus]|uniref:DgyrCDS10323 n=1 Tax=Dimorphilus gyrociliatus TaxID=2664684 RepID=A0A7I8W120_9ANNE|nr:DgyrCDS10323 [Dimorphilus gyrociliatus]
MLSKATILILVIASFVKPTVSSEEEPVALNLFQSLLPDDILVVSGEEDCIPNPCKHGGTCRIDSTTGGRVCDCFIGYSGNECETDLCGVLSYCNSENEQGYCDVPADGSIPSCVCFEGYSGQKCQTIDICIVANPCVSGTCVNNGQCECPTSVTGRKIKFGDKCQFINPCFSQPCQNGGTCEPNVVDNEPTYNCNCDGNYEGDLCEKPQLVKLYPYLGVGTPIDFPTKDNDHFEIDLHQPFKIFCSEVNSIFVNVNGYVSLGTEFDRNSITLNRFITPQSNIFVPVLAPFWVDAMAETFGSSYGQVYYSQYSINEAENSEMARYVFSLAKHDIVDQGVDPQFEPDWIMIVTWDKMRNMPAINQYNTFQLVMVQDSAREVVYVFFLFDTLGWKFNSYAVSLGVVSGVRGVTIHGNGYRSITFRGSKPALFRLDTFAGNFPDKRTGRYYFKVNYPSGTQCLAPATPESKCFGWAAQQTNWNFVSLNRRAFSIRARACPCSERTIRSMGYFKRWRRSSSRPLHFIDNSFRERCYTSRFTRLGSEGIVCCYRGVFGTYQLAKSVLVLNNPNVRRSYDDFAADDYVGYDNCCRKSNLCAIFLRHRMWNICRNPFVRWAFFFGDPHITTIDGRGYTFNGLGEYTLLKYGSASNTEFDLQARTARAIDKNNKASLATVFTAVTGVDIKTNHAGFVGLKEGTQNEIEILVRLDSDTWIDKTADFSSANSDEELEELGEYLTIKKNGNSSVELYFSESDLRLGVTAELGQITLSVVIGDSWKATAEKKTQGLYGLFDGDDTNDFLKSDGTTLSKDASESEIYSEFGESWKISKPTSRMYYKNGQDANTFIDTTFRPIFKDEFSAEQVKAAEDKCGGPDKISCVYDFLATGKEDVAEAAKKSSEDTQEINKLSNNNPPNITIESGVVIKDQITYWAITAGEKAEILFSVVDSDKDDEVSLRIEDIPPGATVDGLKLTWTNPDTTDVLPSVKAYAIDKLNATSSSILIQIRYCGCQNTNPNKAKCNFDKIAKNTNSTNEYMRALCNCDVGWTGSYCDIDFDACDSPSPCPVNCTDKTPAEQKASNLAYQCEGCPTGLTMNNDKTKCIDEDECLSNSACGANTKCANTDGSYECLCEAGYEKAISGDKSCTNVNECEKGLSDCPFICEDTPGNFTCQCPPGYEDKNSDGKSCKVLATLQQECDQMPTPCANSQCEYVTGNSGSVHCVCDSRHQLKADQVTCEDFDECSDNSRNNCDLTLSTCNNTDGDYDCVCKAGYKWAAESKKTCEECDPGTWGINCANTCNCKIGTDCDPASGCTECENGYGPLPYCNEDINECELIADRCGSHGSCKNLNGTFKCICDNGYTWPSLNSTCIDIDECKIEKLNICQDICENLNGSFKCGCFVGHKLNNDNFTCYEVNECNSNPCRNGGACINNINSFSCNCKTGFYGRICENEYVEKFYIVEFLLKEAYFSDNSELKQNISKELSIFYNEQFGANYTGLANVVLNELNKQFKFEGKFKVLHPDNVTELVNGSILLKEFIRKFKNKNIGQYSYALNSVKQDTATTVNLEGSFVLSSLSYVIDYANPLSSLAVELETKITNAVKDFYSNHFGPDNYLGVDAFSYTNYTDTSTVRVRYVIVLEESVNRRELVNAFNVTVLMGTDTIQGTDLTVIRRTVFQGVLIQLPFATIDATFVLTNEKYNDAFSETTTSQYKTLRQSIIVNIEPRYKNSLDDYDEMGDVTFEEAANSNIQVKFPVKILPEKAKPNLAKISIEFIENSKRTDATRVIKDLTLITSSISHDSKVFSTALCEIQTSNQAWSASMSDVSHSDATAIINKIKNAVEQFYKDEFSTKYLGIFNWKLSDVSGKVMASYEVGISQQIIDGNDLVNKFYTTIMKSSNTLGSTDIEVDTTTLRQEEKLPQPVSSFDAEAIITNEPWKATFADAGHQDYTDLKNKIDTALLPIYNNADSISSNLLKSLSDYQFSEASNSQTKVTYKATAKDGQKFEYDNITKLLRYFLKTSEKVSRTERKIGNVNIETLSFKTNGRFGQVTMGEFIIYNEDFSSALSNTASAAYTELKNKLTASIEPFYTSYFGTKFLDTFNWKFEDHSSDIKVSYEISVLLQIIPNDFVVKFDDSILKNGETINNTNYLVTRRSVIQDIQLPLPPALQFDMLFISSDIVKQNDKYNSDTAPESIALKTKVEDYFKSLPEFKEIFDAINTITFAKDSDDKLKMSFKVAIYQGKTLPTITEIYKIILLSSSRDTYDSRTLGTLLVKPDSIVLTDKDSVTPTLTSFWVKFIVANKKWIVDYETSTSSPYTDFKKEITDVLNPFFLNTLKLTNVETFLFTLKNASSNTQVSLEVLYKTGGNPDITQFDNSVLSNKDIFGNTSYTIIRSSVYFNGFLPNKEITFSATIKLDWKAEYETVGSSEYKTLSANLAIALKDGFTKESILGNDFIGASDITFTRVSKKFTGVSGKLKHSANELPDMAGLLDKLIKETENDKNTLKFGNYKLLIRSISLNGKEIEVLPSLVTFTYTYNENMKDLASTEAKDVIQKIRAELTPFYQNRYGASFSTLVILALFKGSVQASTLVTLTNSPSVDDKNTLFTDLVEYSKNKDAINENKVAISGKASSELGNNTLITIYLKDFSKQLTSEEGESVITSIKANVPTMLSDAGISVLEISVETPEFISISKGTKASFSVKTIGTSETEIEQVFKDNTKIGTYSYNSNIDTTTGYAESEKLSFEGTVDVAWSKDFLITTSSKYTSLVFELSKEIRSAFKDNVFGDNYTTTIDFEFSKTSSLYQTNVKTTIIHKFDTIPDVYGVLSKLFKVLTVDGSTVVFVSRKFTLRSIKLDNKGLEVLPAIVTFNYDYKEQMKDIESAEAKDVIPKIKNQLENFYSSMYRGLSTSVHVLALHRGSVIASTLVTLSRSSLSDAESKSLYEALIDHAKNNSNIDATRISLNNRATQKFGIRVLLKMHITSRKDGVSLSSFNEDDQNKIKHHLLHILVENGYSIIFIEPKSMTKANVGVTVENEITGLGLNATEVEEFIKKLDSIDTYNLNHNGTVVEVIEEESDKKVLYIIVGVIVFVIVVIMIATFTLCYCRKRIERADNQTLTSDQQSSIYSGGLGRPKSRFHWQDTGSSIESNSDIGQSVEHVTPARHVDWGVLSKQAKNQDRKIHSRSSNEHPHQASGWVSYKIKGK